MLPEAPRMSATPAHADPAALRARLAALPGVSVRDTDHAALGYDLEVRVPATAVPEAVGLLDAAGYFLEGMTGVDWLGERETLLKEAKAKAAAAAKAAADAEAAADGAATAPAAAPQEAAPAFPKRTSWKWFTTATAMRPGTGCPCGCACRVPPRSCRALRRSTP